MHASIGTKIGSGFALALLALLAVGLVATWELRELTNNTAWVTHTIEVQNDLEAVQGALPEAESSVRGYNIAPLPELKTSFTAAAARATGLLAQLRTLTADNPVQQGALDDLMPLVHDRFEMLHQLLQMNPGALDDVHRQEMLQQGIQSSNGIRQVIGDMKDEELRLLQQRRQSAERVANMTSWTIKGGSSLAILLVGLVGYALVASITAPLRRLGEAASIIGGGDYSHRVRVTSKDEVGKISHLFNRMARQVEERQLSLAEQDDLKRNIASFSDLFQGQRDLRILAAQVLPKIAALLEARHAVLYLADQDGEGPYLRLHASYAADDPQKIVRAGDGLVGQCLLDRQRLVLSDVPRDYLKIRSGLGEAAPASVIVQPVVFEHQTKAVLELATLQPLTPIQLTFLDQFSGHFGMVLNAVEAFMRTADLLRQARQSELLLQEQQEELQQTNEEMEQTNEEMQQTNEEMEEKVNLLAEQKRQLEGANQEIEKAREELEVRSQQIAEASRYKSEFLANMSHELRTPLNSLLILSKMLADNGDANLTAKQVKYAQTIYSSGTDLLELINEVLDLAKIESGSVVIEPQPLLLRDLHDFLDQSFRPVAEGKHLALDLKFSSALPVSMLTDGRRLQQILKNLLSNAFKFTESGGIQVSVAPSARAWRQSTPALDAAPSVLAFAVTDSGPGIPADKRELIFGAFQQADAGTARKYGGTGLGLSISRELAALLGGTLELTDSSERGSTFTLFLPENLPSGIPVAAGTSSKPALFEGRPPPPPPAMKSAPMPLPAEEGNEDDRAAIKPGDTVLLVIEDDVAFGNLMRDFAREKGFKAVVARSAEQGMALARQIQPAAITLDLHLPDNDGWVVLDRLKHDPATRHVPVHVISVDQERERSMRNGAVSYIQKPATRENIDLALTQTMDFIKRPLKNLLIIEDDSVQRESLADLIGDTGVRITAVGNAQDALRALAAGPFDCIVLDLGLPDISGPDLIRAIHEKLGRAAPPIVVYTGKELSRAEETELRLISDSIVIKNVRSPERLLDETALFLHRIQTKLPESKGRMIELAQRSDELLAGRKVLIVDDDVRNIFALTSALESSQMVVKYAESGQGGIDLLEQNPDVEIVLMDVMMPEMDGYEAIRRIRRQDRFRRLPIISVTAKAMKDDREKCLEAGASDYITKPVDLDQLRSLLRVWLYK